MPRLLVLYHYFHPDDVVSARHFTDLCIGLREHGWEIAAAPCNRACRDENKSFPAAEKYHDITISRVWRPPFRQASGSGRILNALWMMTAWAVKVADHRFKPDVVLIGTEPIFGYLTALAWRKFRPQVKLAHWCFDLYPDAAVADGILAENSLFMRKLKPAVSRAFESYDLVADIGPCMRERIRAYAGIKRSVSLTPWALEEPPAPLAVDRAERQKIFGDAQLGILYSGSFGRAHDFALTLQLARCCRQLPVRFAYSVRGNRVRELEAALQPDDKNIVMVPFADESRLAARLSCADVHMMSLRSKWSGAVVPSKFFGSLAAGRPVIYEGEPDSDVGRWINDLKVGWVLTARNLDEVFADIRKICGENTSLAGLGRHCHDIYQSHFSKGSMIAAWDAELKRLVG